jgi:hypothetical protein
MSVILQGILKNIPMLTSEEVKALIEELKEISLQIERKDKIRQSLLTLRGRGKGVWPYDAQLLINEMRTDRD